MIIATAGANPSRYSKGIAEQRQMDDVTTGGQGSQAGQKDRWQRLSLFIMLGGVGALVAAGVLFFLSLSGSGYSGPKTVTGFGILGDALTPRPTPTVTLPPPSDAPIARIEIPRFDVDAPIQIKGVDANRVMETPDGPTNVAWYDFSGKPGYGSNAVFSGHVDYIDYGPAVFYRLGELNAGDLVNVKLNDGTVYQYNVVSRHNVPANPSEDELRQIIGPTQQDVITLITCGGNWNGQEYDERVIVRAERYIAPAGATAQ